MRAILKHLCTSHRNLVEKLRETEEGRKLAALDEVRHAEFKARHDAIMGERLAALRRDIDEAVNKPIREREEREKEARRKREEKKRQEEERKRQEAEDRARHEQEERARHEEEALRRQREEEEAIARAAAEAAEQRQKAEERRKEATAAWHTCRKLGRCRGSERHFAPHQIYSACPLCGANGQVVVDAYFECSLAEWLEADYSHSESRFPAPEPDDVAAIEQEIDMRLSIHDYSGIGNLILDLLFLPRDYCQDWEPRESGLLLARRIDGIVATMFGLHEAVTYHRPHRDTFLPPHLRRDWSADTFHQLVIFAFVLGATWQALPDTHEKLRPYYLHLAKLQTSSIANAAAARRPTDRLLNSRYPADIKRQLMSAPPPPVTEDDE
jgi:hypothetical protein